MIRFVTVAALAAFAAAPAHANEVRVSLAGKTEAQIQADVTSAARKVCLRATDRESFRLSAYGRCVQDTVQSALEQI